MWTCPKCGVINYNKGSCECCGYGSPMVYSASDTSPSEFMKELKKNP